MRRFLSLLSILGLAACVAPTSGIVPTGGGPGQTVPMSVVRAVAVVRRIEPVAESVCRAEAPRQNCDFEIAVNQDPRGGVNAFQTIRPETGRPVIILTAGLIREVRNDDELAFVVGHEAAHHIAQHLNQQRNAAVAGARIFGASAIQQGASREETIRAANLGALLGSRQFSQAAELEADSLGTVITCLAGYDPVRGAEFFSQLPDPGVQILGTHPPNAERVQIVRRVAAQRC